MLDYKFLFLKLVRNQLVTIWLKLMIKLMIQSDDGQNDEIDKKVDKFIGR